MAQLIVTVDDAQVDRVRLAYGVATNAQLRTAIINDIKQKVIGYETDKAHTDGQVSVKTAQDNVIASVNNARTSAEAISIT